MPPKKNIEMKPAPHHLSYLPCILKNPSIPLSPHHPYQSEVTILSKSLALSKAPKSHEKNNHHIL